MAGDVSSRVLSTADLRLGAVWRETCPPRVLSTAAASDLRLGAVWRGTCPPRVLSTAAASDLRLAGGAAGDVSTPVVRAAAVGAPPPLRPVVMERH